MGANMGFLKWIGTRLLIILCLIGLLFVLGMTFTEWIEASSAGKDVRFVDNIVELILLALGLAFGLYLKDQEKKS